MTDTLSKEFIIVDESLLHLRPMKEMAMLAKQFESDISINVAGNDDVSYDGKSIYDLIEMLHQAYQTRQDSGTRFVVRCTGSDALQALAAIDELIGNDFFPKGQKPTGA